MKMMATNIIGLVLLPEAYHAVHEKEQEDDGKVVPATQYRKSMAAASIIQGMVPQK
jgi:hypothetical protein